MEPIILDRNENWLNGIEEASSLEELFNTLKKFNISKEEIEKFFSEETQRLETESRIVYPTWEEVLTANGMEGIWEEELVKKRRPQDLPLGWFIIQLHFRGASVHKDFRRKQNSHLKGRTFTDQVAGAITESVDNITKLNRWAAKWKDSGIYKFQPDMGDKNIKVVAIKKADEPLVWATITNVCFPPGSVGATRFEPGCFKIIDEGLSDEGTQKPYFEEYFLRGKYYKGRLVIRLIPVRKEWIKKPKAKLQWQTWMCKRDLNSQLPYLLTARGRKKRDTVPPDGQSWIWKEWENRIPSELRWWKGRPSRAEKLNKMDEAFDFLIDKGFLKFKKLKSTIRKFVSVPPIEFLKEKQSRFILRYHWWKGKKIVRDMPVDHFDVVLDKSEECLDEFAGMKDNPLYHPEGVPCIRHDCCIGTPKDKPNKEWMSFEGEIPPNHPEWGNPNRRIPAYMRILDSGKVNIINDKDDFFSGEFSGKKLKGYWIAKRESKTGQIWVFSKSQFPGEPKD